MPTNADDLSPIVVVLGAHAELLRPELDGLPVHVVENRDWHTGMGGSLRVGLAALRTRIPSLAGVVVTLCDQPLVGAELLAHLVASHLETGRPLVAAAYADTLGVPAFFARSLFPRLEGLADHEGARRIIAEAGDAVLDVPFAAAAHDLDTPEDYRQMLNHFPG